MGFAERVSVDEGKGQEPTSVFHARRQQGRQGGGDSDSASSLRVATAPGAGRGPLSSQGGSFDEAGGASSGDEGTALDAIIEAARAGTGASAGQAPGGLLDATGAPEGQAGAGGSGQRNNQEQVAARPAVAPASGSGRRALQVDNDDRENRLRPRYTGTLGP